MKNLTHINKNGEPGMVDVSNKNITKRKAIAKTEMFLGKEILSLVKDKDISTKKGAVFQTAIIAGTMAVKQTANLIPLCHPLAIQGIKFEVNVLNEECIEIICAVSLEGKTGVEMEALTGASIAALTIYDMCKAINQNMIIKNTRLLEKTGGKSDFNEK